MNEQGHKKVRDTMTEIRDQDVVLPCLKPGQVQRVANSEIDIDELLIIDPGQENYNQD